MRAIFIAVMLTIGLSSAADAATCSRSDFTGSWLVQFSTGTTCRATLAKTGKISRSSCVSGSPAKKSGKLVATLRTSKTCHVVATVKQVFGSSARKFKVDGTLAPSKNSFKGTATANSETITFRAKRQ